MTGRGAERSSAVTEFRASSREYTEPRKLVVAKGISLSGEITECDMLVVAGQVDGSIVGARVLEIADGGLFSGLGEIDEAVVSGRFEGRLKVKGRLLIRDTGRVHGNVEYGELEIHSGGQISGEIGAAVPPGPVSSQPKSTKPAAA
jgi:cytoskeletal protein CcmA (bactofilin family)